MIGTASVLAVIPARGGSKGLPRKNIHPFGNKPLLAWTIEAAQATPEIDRLILSTDDAEIQAVGRQYGCETPFLRPAELAGDTTLSIDVALHLLAILPEKYDYLVWLQPTSPLRSAADISACIQLCVQQRAMSAVTVTQAEKTPYWMFFVDQAQTMRPVLAVDRTQANRQDLPTAYALNGAVYVVQCEWLKQSARFMDEKTLAHIMPQQRSIDIDTKQDLVIAEWLLSTQQ